MLRSGERLPPHGAVNGLHSLLSATRDACKIPDQTVNPAHPFKLMPNSCESLGLFDHVGAPGLGGLQKEGSEALLAMVTRAAPAVPHLVADLDGSLVALLPPPTNCGE